MVAKLDSSGASGEGAELASLGGSVGCDRISASVTSGSICALN